MKKDEICCPTCSKKNTWIAENTSRPFCSPRCKLIDLGEWADENHRIAGDPEEPDSAADENPEENH
ncbi:MAG TPA: DNA gyrase inhibitor YacG [Gammaproteobacteria bacterium]|nr:DNA gyrase inhibitor YacG [Gammaproteobacteria bacterium]